MTPQQATDFLRQLMPVLGSLLTTLGATTGDKWNAISNLVLLISGPSLIGASAVWGFMRNSKAGVISAASAVPEVKTIQLNPTAPETAAINAATPTNVVIGPNH